MKPPLRVAVIGCGSVSRGHVRGWLGEPERARIVALVDVEPRFAEEHRERFGLPDAQLYADLGEVLSREDVDVVDLCTPSHCHAGPTHVFDFMRYLGGEVRDVFAFRERAGTFVLMRFHSGAVGKATAGIASDQGLATPHVLCVQGTDGTLFTQNQRTSDAWGSGGYHGYLVTGGTQEPIEVTATDTGHGDATRTRNFLDAVLDGAPLIAPLEDAVGTSELLHAIWESHNLEIRVPVHRSHKTG